MLPDPSEKQSESSESSTEASERQSEGSESSTDPSEEQSEGSEGLPDPSDGDSEDFEHVNALIFIKCDAYYSEFLKKLNVCIGRATNSIAHSKAHTQKLKLQKRN